MDKVFEWTKLIFISLLIAILINVFVFELFTVKGQSMLPSFHDGEKVFVLKVNKWFNKLPDYQDAIIVDGNVKRERRLIDELLDTAIVSRLLQRQNNDILIKRVVGKPGDTLEYKAGQVYRNGKKLDEEYILEEMVFPFGTVTVPAGYIFVMGDNRNNSQDSRMIGPIPFDNIRGKVMFAF